MFRSKYKRFLKKNLYLKIKNKIHFLRLDTSIDKNLEKSKISIKICTSKILKRKKQTTFLCHRRYASTEPGRDPGALLFWKKLQAREKNYLAHTMMIPEKKDVLIWKEVEAAVKEKINLRLEK